MRPSLRRYSGLLTGACCLRLLTRRHGHLLSQARDISNTGLQVAWMTFRPQALYRPRYHPGHQ